MSAILKGLTALALLSGSVVANAALGFSQVAGRFVVLASAVIVGSSETEAKIQHRYAVECGRAEKYRFNHAIA